MVYLLIHYTNFGNFEKSLLPFYPLLCSVAITYFLNVSFLHVLRIFLLRHPFQSSCNILPYSPTQLPHRDGLAQVPVPILSMTACKAARLRHTCPGFYIISPGCSGISPHRDGLARSAFSRIASARLQSGSASAYLPCALYNPARLFRDVATSGWLARRLFPYFQ